MFRSRVLQHCLHALNRLLKDKCISEEDHELKLADLSQEMCDATLVALRDYMDDAAVVSKACDCGGRLATLSSDTVSQLHADGIVGALLHALDVHTSDSGTVLACAKALAQFPIAFLNFPWPKSADGCYNTLGGSAVVSKLNFMQSVMVPVLESYNILTNGGKDEVEEPRAGYPRSVHVEILEVCLRSIFTTCDSSMNDRIQIDWLLRTLTSDNIRSLMGIIKCFPSHFRILDGSIGTLSYAMDTSYAERLDDDFTDEVEITEGITGCIAESLETENSNACRSAERLSVLLAIDPNLKLLLKAMEKFSVDENIDKFGSDGKSDYQKGVFGMMSRSTNSSSSYTSAMSMKYDTEEDLDMIKKEANKEGRLMYLVQQDKDGHSLSAASLQKSVIYLVGIACDKHREMQQNLLRSRYNELILKAFKNFKDDVHLIRYGCHAILFTCRKHHKHQRILHELDILRHLAEAFTYHGSIWEVVDGVICAIAGLLEPSDEFDNETTTRQSASARKASIIAAPELRKRFSGKDEQVAYKSEEEARKQKLDSYKLAKEIVGRNERNGIQLVQHLALKVAEFQFNPKCQQIVTHFMQLLKWIGYWLPDQWSIWSKRFINIHSKGIVKQVVIQMHRNIGQQEAQQERDMHNGGATTTADVKSVEKLEDEFENLKQDANQPLETFKKSFDEKLERLKYAGGKIPTQKELALKFIYKLHRGTFKSLLLEIENSKPKKGGDSSYPDTLEKAYFIVLTENEKLKAAGKLKSLSVEKISDPNLTDPIEGWFNINQFVFLMLSWNCSNPTILSSGLSLVISLCRDALTNVAEYEEQRHSALGVELPYHVLPVQPSPYQFNDFGILRGVLVCGGALGFCMEAARRRINDPVLVKYSLWLLLIFVSEERCLENFGTSKSVAFVPITQRTYTTVETIVAYIATNDAIEWGISVIKLYKENRTIQSLAVLFLIWMEHHGRFSNRDADLLKELKDALEKLVILSEVDLANNSMGLEDSAVDPYTRDNNTDAFKNLPMYSDRLLRLVNNHLEENVKTEVIPWDSVVRPIAISVLSSETEEDPETCKPCTVYLVSVQWDEELRWTMRIRFRPFYDMSQLVKKEFEHLAAKFDSHIHTHTELERSKKIYFTVLFYFC